MKHPLPNKTGFTIIEVALFLALSGLLMMGIIVGANLSISRQRYNDSVNGFAEFLRGIYSDVFNVSNDKNPDSSTEKAGRTTTAIYGKLVSIGETPDESEGENANTVYVYDLVGNAVGSSAIRSSRVIEMMYRDDSGIHANIFSQNCDTIAVDCKQGFYRYEAYNITWDGRLSRSKQDGDDNGKRFHGAILVIRSPVTGGVRTYSINYDASDKDGVPIRNRLSNQGVDTNFHLQLDDQFGQNFNKFATYLETISDSKINSEQDLYICIDSDDNSGPNRRGVKVAARAANSSGIMLTETDQEDALCEGRDSI